jgi:hypothetical protein
MFGFFRKSVVPQLNSVALLPDISELRVSVADARKIIQDRRDAIYRQGVDLLPEYIPKINQKIRISASEGNDYALLHFERDAWLKHEHWPVIEKYYEEHGFEVSNRYAYLHIRW